MDAATFLDAALATAEVKLDRGSVWVRELAAAELAEVAALELPGDDVAGQVRYMAAVCRICLATDSSGTPMFNGSAPDDVLEQIAGRPMRELEAIATAAMEINGLNTDEDEGKD